MDSKVTFDDIETSRDRDNQKEQQQANFLSNLSPISTNSTTSNSSNTSAFSSSTSSSQKSGETHKFSSNYFSNLRFVLPHDDPGCTSKNSFSNEDFIENSEPNDRDIDLNYVASKHVLSVNRSVETLAFKPSRKESTRSYRFETTVRYTKFNCRKNISMDEDLQIESDSSLCRKRNVHEIDRRPTSDRRRKSIEDNVTSNLGNSSGSNHINHIVSILKRKDSSNSSNASLVTFSPSVVETIRTPTVRQGILKKRSSLDESRYFRSHSPSSASSADEKSCLVNRRRNSFGEINHHGILKQKSYDSNTGDSSGIGSSPNSGTGTVHHGILKKPSSSTPSENQYYSDSQSSHTRHVSISEAVILAAAELCKDMLIIDDGNESISIRPSILKMDPDQHQQQQYVNMPKPILKKNHSTENEEIRSILKTSRKSSREESFS